MYANFRSPRFVRAKLQAALSTARRRRLGRILAPEAFVQANVEQAESSAFSIAIEDGSGDWTTTVSISPALAELTFDGTDLAGTLPAVSAPQVHNVSVRRRNGHGVSYSVFQLTILNTEQSGGR
jgi:hypothetical protein